MRSLPPASTQRGFTMALALALAVVMGVMLMKVGPRLSAEVQRENEAELIFRGEAIATALRVYFAQTKRYPTGLDEVMKVRPRILRQKYRDPMTSSGEWQLVTQVQAGASGDTQGLPIVGGRSRAEKDSVRADRGKPLVRAWLFTAEENLLGGGATTENERTRRSLRGTTPTLPKP